MWKKLHHLSKPQKAYLFCLKWGKWLSLFAVILLCVGWFFGLFYVPPDYQQGNSFRIIYFHVPAAIGSMAAYLFMAGMAFLGLVWQIKLARWSVIAIAPIGAVYTVIALITGAIWGKPMWGTWWVWDARLTSELILLFLYLGVIALYQAFEDQTAAIKAASLLSIVGVINLPIIHYSVVWWNTLHQRSSITAFSGSSISFVMFMPLVFCLFGFAFLFFGLFCLRLRNEILRNEKHRSWVYSFVKVG